MTARGLHRLARTLALVAGLVMLGAAGLVSLDVLFRNAFGAAPFRSFELTSYAFAVTTAFSFGYALYEGRHIRIDVLYQRFPAPVRLTFDFINLALMLGVAGTLAFHGGIAALDSWRIGAHSASSLGVPLAIPQGLWATGLLWFALCAIALAGRSLRNLLSGRYDQVRADIGMSSERVEEQASAL